MPRDRYERSRSGVDAFSFNPMFPTPTAGDGRLRPNNANPGARQPDARPSNKRKVKCRNCGFLADLHKNPSHQGTLEAKGGGGAVTTSDGGDGTTAGDQEYTGAGCPFCFSLNYATEKAKSSSQRR